LVFRGSVGDMWTSIQDQKGDWYRNYLVYPFKNDPDGQRAEDIADDIAKSALVGNKVFYITGHSRGGMLAQRAGIGIVKNNLSSKLEKLVYYNGMGVVWTTASNEAEEMYTTLVSLKDKILFYSVKGDTVSGLGKHPVDTKKLLAPVQCAKDNHDTFAEHHLCNFTAQLMPERYQKQ